MTDSSLPPIFSTLLATPAKVNLGLKIVGRRPDGYHDILTVMEPISLADNLYCEFRPGSEDHFFLFSPQLPELAPADNLVVKAAVAMADLARERGRKVTGSWHFFLDKRIPAGAGLGGGSSNAAAVMLLLNRFYKLKLSREELVAAALVLGADIPFFIDPGLARVEGIGERVTRLKGLRSRWYVLAKPAFGVDTGWAYAALKFETGGRRVVDYDTEQFSRPGLVVSYQLENDFEGPVMTRYPLLARLKEWFGARPECRGTLMSGSGAVVYGIFDSFAAARREFAKARRQWSGEGCSIYLARNLTAVESHAEAGLK